MADLSKPLDTDAWMRRLGQEFVLGSGEIPALSAFIDLPVTALEAQIVPDRVYDPKLLTFRATFTARVGRTCVVTLDEFEEELGGTFERSFILSASAPGTPEGAEEADEFPDAGVSLVDLLGDEIALVLSAFPRKPGAKLPTHQLETQDDEVPERVNPFAVLEQLKK